MQHELRTVDTLARIGGDEFAILMPETPTVAAGQLVARLHSRLLETANQRLWPFTFSLGAVTFTTPPASADILLGEADSLMYEAKAAGKNTWRHQVVPMPFEPASPPLRTRAGQRPTGPDPARS